MGLLQSLKLRICVAVVAGLSLAAPAMADGLPAPAGSYNWSGLYVGGSLGWARTGTDWTYTNPSPAACCASVSVDNSDAMLGGHLGLQHQMGAIVVGIEGAISSSSLFDGGYNGQSGCIIGDPRSCDVHVGAITTVGGRVGYAMNNMLFFAGGGYATARLNSRLVTYDEGSARHNGWYVGGGVEYALSKSVIIGLEYQHISLDTVEHQPSSGTQNYRDIDADVDVVRARVSFKLGREANYEPLK